MSPFQQQESILDRIRRHNSQFDPTANDPPEVPSSSPNAVSLLERVQRHNETALLASPESVTPTPNRTPGALSSLRRGAEDLATGLVLNASDAIAEQFAPGATPENPDSGRREPRLADPFAQFTGSTGPEGTLARSTRNAIQMDVTEPLRLLLPVASSMMGPSATGNPVADFFLKLPAEQRNAIAGAAPEVDRQIRSAVAAVTDAAERTITREPRQAADGEQRPESFIGAPQKPEESITAASDDQVRHQAISDTLGAVGLGGGFIESGVQAISDIVQATGDAVAPISRWAQENPVDFILLADLAKVGKDLAGAAFQRLSSGRTLTPEMIAAVEQRQGATSAAKSIRRKFGDEVPDEVVEEAAERVPGFTELADDAAETPRAPVDTPEPEIAAPAASQELDDLSARAQRHNEAATAPEAPAPTRKMSKRDREARIDREIMDIDPEEIPFPFEAGEDPFESIDVTELLDEFGEFHDADGVRAAIEKLETEMNRTGGSQLTILRMQRQVLDDALEQVRRNGLDPGGQSFFDGGRAPASKPEPVDPRRAAAPARTEATEAGEQGILGGAEGVDQQFAQRKVPDAPIESQAGRPEDVKGGLFEPKAQGEQLSIGDDAAEAADDTFDFGENAARTNEDLGLQPVRPEPLGVGEPTVVLDRAQLKRLEGGLRRKSGGKVANPTPLDVERGLVDAQGNLTPDGRRAFYDNAARLLRESEVDPRVADELTTILQEVEALQSDPIFEGVEAVLEKRAAIRGTTVSREFIERGGRTIEGGELMRLTGGKPEVGPAGIEELPELLDRFPDLDEAKVLDILRAPKRNDLDDIAEAMIDAGLAIDSDEARILAEVFDPRDLDEAARGMIGFNKKRFQQMRNLAKDRVALREAIAGGADPRGIGGLADDAEDIYYGGLPLMTETGASRRARDLWYAVLETVGDQQAARSLLDKTFGFLNFNLPTQTANARQFVQRVYNRRFGQPAEFAKLALMRERAIGGYNFAAMEHFQNLTRNFTEAERKRIGQILNGQLQPVAKATRVAGAPNRGVVGELQRVPGITTNPQFRDAADPIRDLMIELGEEAVGVGLLQQDTFFQNYGAYLPRLYSKSEYDRLLSKSGISRGSKKWRLDQQRFRRRRDKYTIVYDPSTTAPMESPVRRRLPIFKKAAPEITDESKAVARQRLGAQNIPEGQQSFNEIPKGAREVQFLRQEQVDDWLQKNGVDAVIEYVEPLPDEVRYMLGELKDPAYPMARGVMQLGYDVKTAQLMEAIAENPKWSRPASAGAEPGFVPILQSTAPKAFDPIGPLRGRVVLESIAEDVNFLVSARNNAMQMHDQLIRMWKFNKVVANPATHGRNILSNSILADLGGMSHRKQPHYLLKSFLDIVDRDNASTFFREAADNGLMGTTFFDAELNKMFNVWAESYGEEGMSKALSYVNKMRAPAERLGAIYQGEEQVFKLAMYRFAREELGMGIDDAVTHAEKWIFNYVDIPPIIEALRSAPFGMPFVTFDFKAIPRVLEATLDNPLRVAKYAALFAGMEELARRSFGQTRDQVAASNELLPDYLRDKSTGFGRIAPKTSLRLPFAGPDGRQLSLDLGFMVPWGSLAGLAGNPLQDIGTRAAGPYWAPIFMALNRDPFMRSEIYSEDDSASQKWTKSLDYLYRYMVPSLAPAPTPLATGVGAAVGGAVGAVAGPTAGVAAGATAAFAAGVTEGENAIRGGPGFERMRQAVQGQMNPNLQFETNPSIGLTALDVFAGIRTRPIDDEQNRLYRIYEERGILDRIRNRYRAAQRDFERGKISEQQMLSRMEAATEEMERQADKLREIGALAPKPVQRR